MSQATVVRKKGKFLLLDKDGHKVSIYLSKSVAKKHRNDLNATVSHYNHRVGI